MACQHLTIKRKIRGQRAECVNCHLEVIFDGNKWQWFHGLSPRERNEMTRQFDLEVIRNGSS